MLLRPVVAPVAGVHSVAAAEAEPAVTLAIMLACSARGQRLPRAEAQLVLFPDVPGRRGGQCSRSIREEAHVGDLEVEFPVTVAADVGCALAADGDETGRRRGALGADGDEGARQHVGHRGTCEVEEPGTRRVLVDKLWPEPGGEPGGALPAGGCLLGLVLQAGDVVDRPATFALHADAEDGDLQQFNAVELDAREG